MSAIEAQSVKGLAGVAVGDVLMVSMFGKPYTESTVTAVGRKWLTAAGTKFDVADGRMQGQYMGDAVTLAQHAAFIERLALDRMLRESGVETPRARLSVDQLRRILAIAREPSA